MKDYKRLTDRVTAEMLRNTEEESWDSDNIEAQCYIRLAELEDKIERGELCDRDEVRKETAKKIIYQLRNLSHVGHLRSELDLLCRGYCIKENEQ